MRSDQAELARPTPVRERTPEAAALDAVAAHVAILDGTGVIVGVNAAWRRFAEENSPACAPREVGVGVSYLQVCTATPSAPDPIAAAAAEGIARVLSGTGAHFELEYPCDAPWAPRWFLMTATPLPGGGAVVSHLDITRRRRAEEEVRRLNDALETHVEERTRELGRFRALAEASTDFVAMSDPDGRLLFANGALRAVCGDRPGLAAYHTSAAAVRLEAEALPAAARLGHWRGESEVLARDGAPLPVSQVVLGHRAPGGGPPEFFSAIMRDDRERLRMHEALRASQERLLLATAAGKVGVWDWDVVNDSLTWDDSMYALYGVPRERFAGAYQAWQAGVHPDDRARTDEEIQRALRGETPFDTEFRVRWPDGTVRVIRAHGLVRRDAADRATRMVGTNWDITEAKVAEAAIQRLNEDLAHRATEVEAANKELEAFSYTVSHDLRAPLRAIDGFSRILLEDHAPGLSAEVQELLRDVRGGAQRMGHLVDDLLAFSRLGRTTLQRREVDVGRVVKRCLAELAPSGGHLEARVGQLPTCTGDPALLAQVWSNLLGNAVKFTSRRDPAVIEVGGERRGEEVEYFVRDNGVGFDPRHASKLFGVFQRLHRAEDYEGTGVGLAIVKRIVQRHGGRVWAEGEPDRGATFHVVLPAAGQEEAGARG